MAERTGKRNLHYNRRHRIYGSGMTMIDVDNLEYDAETNMPLALIETKYGIPGLEVDLTSSEFDVLCNLARELPVFLLVYYPMDKFGNLLDANDPHENLAHMQFCVAPVNDAAMMYVPKKVRMTELEWVNVLRRLHDLPETKHEAFCNTWKDCFIPFVINRSLKANKLFN